MICEKCGQEEAIGGIITGTTNTVLCERCMASIMGLETKLILSLIEASLLGFEGPPVQCNCPNCQSRRNINIPQPCNAKIDPLAVKYRELKIQLQKAIDEEDYQTAAKIRDTIAML